MVYVGVATPKGEKEHKISRFFTESQVNKAAELMKGLPVHINHETTTKDGKKVPPSGMVLKGHIHPKTGDLWVLFTLFPGQAGALARRFLGEDGVLKDDTKMSQLSLGFNIFELPGDIPIGHNVKELSICYEACRPGCEIKGKFPLSAFHTPQGEGVSDTHLTNICEDINNNKIKIGEMFQLPSSKDSKPIPRPEGAQELAKQINLVETKASVAVDTTPVPMEAAAPAPQDPASLKQEAMALMQALTGEKRNREEVKEEQKPQHQINLQQYVIPEQPFQEVPPPPGLTEEAILVWKAQQEQLKKTYEENLRFKQEAKKQRISRLQGAASEVIPTLLGMMPGINIEDLEKFLANMDSVSPNLDNAMTSLIEAQASQQKKIQKEREDINTLQKRLEEENSTTRKQLEAVLQKLSELEKSQKPLFQSNTSSASTPAPLVPAVKQPTPPTAQSQLHQQLDNASMIFAQAAKKSQAQYPELTEQQILAQAKKLSELFSDKRAY
jgi:hypothetical protein